MYTPKKAYFYGTGRRKSSVARVRLFPGGTGEIKINNRTIDNYFGLETLKMVCRQPFEVTGTEGKFDVECTVSGGGFTGQAGAQRDDPLVILPHDLLINPRFVVEAVHKAFGDDLHQVLISGIVFREKDQMVIPVLTVNSLAVKP